MKSLYLRVIPYLGLCFLLGCEVGTRETSDTKIIGGELAPNYRFMAGLVFDDKNETGCGGTFVSKQVIVTAAHCVEDLNRKIRVRIGGDNRSPEQAPLLEVHAVVLHPTYDPKELLNDIAIVVVDGTDPSLNILPIEFAGDFDPIAHRDQKEDDTFLTVIGRGNTTSVGVFYEDLLRQVDLPYVSPEQCQKAHQGEVIPESVLCAGNITNGGKDSCQGDSGGPLISGASFDPKLVGVISWGDGCAQAGKPGVYTKVGYYRNWIQEQVSKFALRSVEVNSKTLPDLFSQYCYNGVGESEPFGAESPMGKATWDYSVSSKFVEIAPRDEEAQQMCQMNLPGRTLTAVRFAGDPEILTISEGPRTWQANLKKKLSKIEMQCSDLELTYYTQGHSYIEASGAFYLFGDVFKGELSTEASRVSCIIGDKSFELYVQPDDTTEEKFRYLVLLKGDAFYSANRLIELEKWGGGNGELHANIEVDPGEIAGTIGFENRSKEDLYTWKLKCNFAYTLKDELGHSYQSQTPGGETSHYHVSFVSPEDPHASFPKNSIKQFGIELEQPLPEDPKCSINDLDLVVTGIF